MSTLEPVAGFRMDLPVRVAFGDGVVAELPEVLDELGATRAAVLLESRIAALEPVVAAIDTCSRRGVRVERFLKPEGEPTFAAAAEAESWLRSVRPEVLVAIGGGSTIDLAKVARLLAEQGGPLGRFVGEGATMRAPSLPLVALPTTSGTGSEVSLDAVITDEASHVKVGFNSPALRPQQALVDPLLTVTLPAPATAFSGIDALAQAIGGVVTTRRNPVSVALGLESCRLVGRSLERAVCDGSDLAARRDLTAGSLLAGLAMSSSECAARAGSSTGRTGDRSDPAPARGS